jgi:NADH-quinone oxidoreductase subunit J
MVGTIAFGLLGAIAIVAALGMLLSSNAVHAALYLIVNFACIALMYLGLNAPFLAMVQITVYAGAIMVLFLFVIMLLGAEKVPLGSKLRWQRPLAIILALALVGVTAFVLFSPEIGSAVQIAEPLPGAEPLTFGSPAAIGTLLFSNYLFPFELTSVLLLAAMLGAVVLTRDEKPRDKK